MSKLSEYLKIHSIRQTDFGKSIGLSQGAISRLCNDAVGISLQTAAEIERETKGEVPIASWLNEAEQRKGAAA